MSHRRWSTSFAGTLTASGPFVLFEVDDARNRAGQAAPAKSGESSDGSVILSEPEKDARPRRLFSGSQLLAYLPCSLGEALLGIEIPAVRIRELGSVVSRLWLVRTEK